MAIIFMDSFDGWGTSNTYLYQRGYLLPDPNYSPVVVDAVGRWGTRGLRSGGNTRLQRLIPQGDTFIVGFSMKVDLWSGSQWKFVLLDGATGQVDLRVDGSGYPYVTRNGTTLGTSAYAQTPTVTYYMEMKAKIHPSTGGVWVREDGIDRIRIGCYAISPTGLNTSATGNPYANSYVLGNWNGGGYNYFDDFYLLDGVAPNNDFLGDVRVEYLAPAGVGTRTQFTGVSAANWQNVDETTPTDGDYNQSSTIGATDLFVLPDIGNGLVHGVQTVLRYKKDDAGFRTVQPVLYRADVNDGGDPPPSTTSRWYRGTKAAVSDSFAGSLQSFDVSPLSGLSWTKDEINALQFGYAVGDAAMFTIDAKLV